MDYDEDDMFFGPPPSGPAIMIELSNIGGDQGTNFQLAMLLQELKALRKDFNEKGSSQSTHLGGG